MVTSPGHVAHPFQPEANRGVAADVVVVAGHVLSQVSNLLRRRAVGMALAVLETRKSVGHVPLEDAAVLRMRCTPELA